MQLTFEQLKDKILGCWTGKNVGGALGAPPLEGYRQIHNYDFYPLDFKGNPPPNDDLDLQIVWLAAVEKFGRQVDAHILGQYWLSYIVPDWVEYGTGKSNLRAGVMPPLSGYLENGYGNSCGCFIRSEIWACLCPGHPELAARYAYEDAIVDHCQEGVFGEVFCAAIQSSAFIESDKYKLIDIGLSYIPTDCGVARAVNSVIDSYKKGLKYLEARKVLFNEVPGNFGLQFMPLDKIDDEFPIGTAGYDAPSNIGIFIIGWLYGEDDFGKSLCIAVNCGDDTDCTAATLGAIFGIIHGASNLPEKWTKPLNGVINTCCINLHGGIFIPKTDVEFTDRILRIIPSFLGLEYCDILGGKGFTLETEPYCHLMCPPNPKYIPYINGGGFEVECDGELPKNEIGLTLIEGKVKPKELPINELLSLVPYGVKYNFLTFYAVLNYVEEPYIKIYQPRKLKLTVYDNGVSKSQKWINVKIYTPDGITSLQGKSFSAPLQNTYKAKTEFEFVLFAEQIPSEKVEFLVDISVVGTATNGVVKGTLYTKA